MSCVSLPPVQVLNAFSFGVGDVLIGTDPVDGRPESIAAVETALRDVVRAFGLTDTLPWCVLGHIDAQAQVARSDPHLVPLMFQSLAGTDSCLRTFDLSVDKLMHYARTHTGGFYFETGQGADFTNGGAHGLDMVVLEVGCLICLFVCLSVLIDPPPAGSRSSMVLRAR